MDGYSLDWVARGDNAILALQQHQYDCVLLDRGLPKATGDDVSVALRKNTAYKRQSSLLQPRTAYKTVLMD